MQYNVIKHSEEQIFVPIHVGEGSACGGGGDSISGLLRVRELFSHSTMILPQTIHQTICSCWGQEGPAGRWHPHATTDHWCWRGQPRQQWSNFWTIIGGSWDSSQYNSERTRLLLSYLYLALFVLDKSNDNSDNSSQSADLPFKLVLHKAPLKWRPCSPKSFWQSSWNEL